MTLEYDYTWINIYYIFFSHEQHETKCLLDLLEYYTHANQELSATLGRTSQKLRQLEVENKSQQQSQS